MPVRLLGPPCCSPYTSQPFPVSELALPSWTHLSLVSLLRSQLKCHVAREPHLSTSTRISSFPTPTGPLVTPQLLHVVSETICFIYSFLAWRPPTEPALPTCWPPSSEPSVQTLCRCPAWMPAKTGQSRTGRAALPVWTARKRREKEVGGGGGKSANKQVSRVGRVGSAGGP